ncbi:MAG: histidine phosphatase family protein [Woeseiaceae bacterium]
MTLPEREFIFLRHGETQYNRDGRLQGQRDVPLNELGRAQARSAADMLANRQITRVVASPATRVQQTIKPFLQTHDLPLHIEDDLMEYFVGSFEGRLATDIRREHGLTEEASLWSVLPDDAEHWPDFLSRAVSAVERWTRQYAGETILIASHGLVFRVLVETLTGKERYSRNAEPHSFSPVVDGWAINPLVT